MHESPVDVCDASLSKERHDWEKPDKGANGHVASKYGYDRSAMGEPSLHMIECLLDRRVLTRWIELPAWSSDYAAFDEIGYCPNTQRSRSK